MTFNSVEFLIFFPIVVLLYFLIPKKLKNLWLLVCSYYFYMSWNPRYVMLIAASTLITWLGGLLIGNVKKAGACKEVPPPPLRNQLISQSAAKNSREKRSVLCSASPPTWRFWVSSNTTTSLQII